MAEIQSQHRQQLEKKVVDTNSRDSLLGILSGVVVSGGVLGVAIVAVLQGFGTAGAVIASMDLVGLAAVFVYGTKANRKKLGERQSANTPPRNE